MCSLICPLMDKMGVSLEHFGDADTRLAGILAEESVPKAGIRRKLRRVNAIHLAVELQPGRASGASCSARCPSRGS